MAARYDLKVDQDSEFSIIITWQDANSEPIPNDGFTGRLQVRERYSEDAPALITLNETTGLTFGGSDGRITIKMTATQTGTLPEGDCVYDLRIVDTDNKPHRLLEGKCIVSPSVTKPDSP